MCGKQYHMLNELRNVIRARSPTLKKLYPVTDETFAFMFAKKGCPKSQEARYHMMNKLNIPPDNITILDVAASKLICATKWEWLENNEDTNKQRLDLFNLWSLFYCNPQKKIYSTVPQVFLHFPHKWYFVEGGCDGLKGLGSASATVDNTQVSDLLHLLPLVREGRRTPPIQLKF